MSNFPDATASNSLPEREITYSFYVILKLASNMHFKTTHQILNLSWHASFIFYYRQPLFNVHSAFWCCLNFWSIGMNAWVSPPLSGVWGKELHWWIKYSKSSEILLGIFAPWTNGSLFSNRISFSNIVYYICTIFLWKWSNIMHFESAPWILLAWCFSTRASVVKVLR